MLTYYFLDTPKLVEQWLKQTHDSIDKERSQAAKRGARKGWETRRANIAKRNLSRPKSTPHGASGSAAISPGADASQIGA